MKLLQRLQRTAALLFSLILLSAPAAPMASKAVDTVKTVRVGWHEAPYFITDQYGRRSCAWK